MIILGELAYRSHDRWRARIENGQISVNGAAEQDPSFRLRFAAALGMAASGANT